MILHEDGPELVFLPKGAKILPNMSEQEYAAMCKQISFTEGFITIKGLIETDVPIKTEQTNK